MSLPKTPLLTVDAYIRLDGGKIVIIERKNAPLGFALPGGFVDIGEDLETAVMREAKEEVSLDVAVIGQVYAFSDPKRDPRGHTVSVLFACGADGTPKAADDAKAVHVVTPKEALKMGLLFDHSQMVRMAMEYLS